MGPFRLRARPFLLMLGLRLSSLAGLIGVALHVYDVAGLSVPNLANTTSSVNCECRTFDVWAIYMFLNSLFLFDAFFDASFCVMACADNVQAQRPRVTRT